MKQNKLKRSLKISTSLAVILTMGACAQTPSSTKTINLSAANQPAEQNLLRTWLVTAEQLLNAKVAPLTTNSVSLQDPLAAHAAAHDVVNPDQTRGNLQYTQRLDKKRIFTANNFRALTLQPKSLLFNDGFKVADISLQFGVSDGIPQPAQKPSYDSRYDTIQLAEAPPAPAPAETQAAVEEAQPTPQRYAVAELAGQAPLEVINMRMGDYEDKTRLVFDLNAAAKFDYDLNNLSSILTVHIDGAGWSLDSQRYFDNHPLISSYEVEETEGSDTMLHIALKKPSKMLMSGFVRPDKIHGHRIFFDVAAL